MRIPEVEKADKPSASHTVGITSLRFFFAGCGPLKDQVQRNAAGFFVARNLQHTETTVENTAFRRRKRCRKYPGSGSRGPPAYTPATRMHARRWESQAVLSAVSAASTASRPHSPASAGEENPADPGSNRRRERSGLALDQVAERTGLHHGISGLAHDARAAKAFSHVLTAAPDDRTRGFPELTCQSPAAVQRGTQTVSDTLEHIH